jgi:hypothetical protein
MLIYKMRRHFSSYLFDKGKLSLSKLKDKHNVDAAIEHVQMVFPDQYGRLWSNQVHAATFIAAQEKSQMTKANFNPFLMDLHGAKLELPQENTEDGFESSS